MLVHILKKEFKKQIYKKKIIIWKNKRKINIYNTNWTREKKQETKIFLELRKLKNKKWGLPAKKMRL